MREGALYSPIYDQIGDLLTKNGYTVTVLERDVFLGNQSKRYRSGKGANRLVGYSIKAYDKLSSIFEKIKPFRFISKFNLVLFLYEINRIRQYKIAAVIGVNPGRELCFACSLYTVPVFDYQHGRPDLGNKYYHALDGIPRGQRPTGILAWDEWSRNVMQNKCSSVLVTKMGYPFPNPHIEKNKKNSSKRKLLVCLGWGMTKRWDGVSVGLPSWFLNEIGTLTITFHIVVRAHPMSVRRYGVRSVKNAIRKAFGEKVVVDLAQERDVVEAMLSADATVTRFSATSLEGQLLNVPNIFINNPDDPVSPCDLGDTVYNMSALNWVLESVLQEHDKNRSVQNSFDVHMFGNLIEDCKNAYTQ